MTRRPAEDYVKYAGHNADGSVRLQIDLALFAVYDKEEALDAIMRVGKKYEKGEKNGGQS